MPDRRAPGAIGVSRHIALLRAVNVGGRPAPSADLRAMFGELGLGDARTLLQSGNVVFEAGKSADSTLEKRLEAAFEKRFGFASDVLIRSAAEWRETVAANPFPNEALNAPARLLLFALVKAPGADKAKALQADWPGPEQVKVIGRESYIVYPDGIGPSKLTNQVIERRLGVRGTGRNWNTVLKLAALTGSS
jgi:uncharacterized protein (DUF1697 family)